MIVAAGWAGFVWLWLLVGRGNWDSRALVWVIVGSLIVLPLLTAGWILHNRWLYRRKGERRRVVVADLGYARDWYGRAVQADWPRLQAANRVTIDVQGETKRYRAGAAPADAAAARAIAVSDVADSLA